MILNNNRKRTQYLTSQVQHVVTGNLKISINNIFKLTKRKKIKILFYFCKTEYLNIVESHYNLSKIFCQIPGYSGYISNPN